MRALKTFGTIIAMGVIIFYIMIETLGGGWDTFFVNLKESQAFNRDLNEFRNEDGTWQGQRIQDHTIIRMTKRDHTCIISDYGVSMHERPTCYPNIIMHEFK